MLGGVAEFKRSIIQERIHAGLARARTKGVRLGRPPVIERLAERQIIAVRAAAPEKSRAPSPASWVSPSGTCAVYLPGSESEKLANDGLAEERVQRLWTFNAAPSIGVKHCLAFGSARMVS